MQFKKQAVSYFVFNWKMVTSQTVQLTELTSLTIRLTELATIVPYTCTVGDKIKFPLRLKKSF